MGKAILIVAVLALVIYALLRLWERRRAARLPRPPRPHDPGTRRTIAPDDDMDFLRDLERRRRREKGTSHEEPRDPDGS